MRRNYVTAVSINTDGTPITVRIGRIVYIRVETPSGRYMIGIPNHSYIGSDGESHPIYRLVLNELKTLREQYPGRVTKVKKYDTDRTMDQVGVLISYKLFVESHPLYMGLPVDHLRASAHYANLAVAVVTTDLGLPWEPLR